MNPLLFKYKKSESLVQLQTCNTIEKAMRQKAFSSFLFYVGRIIEQGKEFMMIHLAI